MASRVVTPPSSPTRWSGSRARRSCHYASRQAPTRSPPSSRRPTTSWLRPTPTVTCPLHLLLRRRELLRIPIPRTPVNSVGLSQSVQGKDEGDGGDVAIAAVDDFDEVLERFKQAGNEFMKGNPKPVQELFSHRDDVTLANPFGPPARGWNEVAKTQERGASYYRDGEIYAFETVAKYVTPELACILWIERTNAKVGGAEEVTPCDLRVTMTLRPEDGSWKVVHRHADPITSARPAESVIQE